MNEAQVNWHQNLTPEQQEALLELRRLLATSSSTDDSIAARGDSAFASRSQSQDSLSSWFGWGAPAAAGKPAADAKAKEAEGGLLGFLGVSSWGAQPQQQQQPKEGVLEAKTPADAAGERNTGDKQPEAAAGDSPAETGGSDKEQTVDLHHLASDDHTLMRFLRARNWDAGAACKMFRTMLDWRQRNGVDTILDDFVFEEHDAVRDAYPHFYHNTDKFGRPVYYELLGSLNLERLMEVTSFERLERYHIFRQEQLGRFRMPACSAAAGRPVLQSCCVLDVQGAGLSHFSTAVKQYMQAVTRSDQDNYPERLGQCFIVNAPWAFSSIWALVSMWLDENTRQKIQVLGPAYKEALLEVIPEEKLSYLFGGKSQHPTNVDIGPWDADEPMKQPLREPRDPMGMAPGLADDKENAGVNRAEIPMRASAGKVLA